ncbi:Bug family tripartite tricarboxylate transporter substrate binding protein [Hydrogenophaga sp. BPS33]|uniref:Bug family tripartite tricarboxylate transporter substrate binding protein n=1 Tax=Hydrogenophaga sp. BPS33 TaxID=2651974 RepID=UPI0013200E2F|nr:tripartite tricarboxylate transporter substrate binding protein [Hydrogenophaga sp. BPS33]QHE88797.1 tripartite tricarboxylate transporter substrate binding protein [Hydrogenophaga sp. BPS33]
MITMKRLSVVLALLLASLSATAADPYPSRPIRMVIGFAPGGPTDVAARQFAAHMGDVLGQAVVVDNKAGAGGMLATTTVIAAPPDGYTILFNTSSLVLQHLLSNNAKYDPLKDLTAVVRTSGVPLVLTSSPSVPAKTLPELMALAAKGPSKMNFGSSGAGTIDHLAFALLANLLAMKFEHVPYKGQMPAYTDLMSGNIQVLMRTINTVQPFAVDKKMNALAIASANRSPLMPNVPTVSEATGLKDVALTAWTGIMAPLNTPPEIVEKLNQAANHALKDKAFLDKLRASGSEPYGGSAEEYRAFLRSETARWKVVIERAGVEKQ